MSIVLPIPGGPFEVIFNAIFAGIETVFEASGFSAVPTVTLVNQDGSANAKDVCIVEFTGTRTDTLKTTVTSTYDVVVTVSCGEDKTPYTFSDAKAQSYFVSDTRISDFYIDFETVVAGEGWGAWPGRGVLTTDAFSANPVLAKELTLDLLAPPSGPPGGIWNCNDDPVLLVVGHDNGTYTTSNIASQTYWIAFPWNGADVACGTTPPSKDIKIMVVGDSISHGMEADYTWRAHMYDWFKDEAQDYNPIFVGPYSGTNGPTPVTAILPRPPLLPGEVAYVAPTSLGLYATDVAPEFQAMNHASFWGRQIAQDIPLIQGWVETYQPDLILCLLGFNDLGWWVSDAKGTLASMEQLVANMRAGKPDVKIMLGNVVNRLFIEGRQDLVDNTIAYNSMLLGAVLEWTTTESPIIYVDVAANYNCAPASCPDGYDGLHPTALGEYHIAQAFAHELVQQLDIGTQYITIPSDIPARSTATPTGFEVIPVDEGLLIAWEEVFGYRGYQISSRIQGETGWWSNGPEYPTATESYFTWCEAGQVWEFQVATLGDHNILGPPTALLSATCNPGTAPGPPNIVVEPVGSDGISFSFDAVLDFNVNRYVVIVWDQDVTGAFLNAFSTTSLSYTVTGLVEGHVYGTWVTTWIELADGKLGGGPPEAARQVIVGEGMPPVVTGLTVVNDDPTTVTLTWDAAGASGYAVTFRSLINDTYNGVDGTTIGPPYSIAFLFPGTWNYEFCVSAYNGNLEAACSAFVTPSVYPGFTESTLIELDTTNATAAAQNIKSTAVLGKNNLLTLAKAMHQNTTLFPS